MKYLILLLLLLVPLALAQSFTDFNVTMGVVDPTCSDLMQNQNETQVDCGGPCPACPSCSDGIQNQGEEDIDCGGPCPNCPSCSDGIQNQGEEDVDCGGPCAECDSGGGGGGGGGGSSSVVVTPNTTVTEEKDDFFLVLEKEIVTAQYNESSVLSIELKFVNKVANISLEKHVVNKVRHKQNFSKYNYQYFKLEGRNFNLSDVKEITINHKVNKTWLLSQNTSFSGVVLLNYRGIWVQTPTKFISQDDDFYYFESISNSLGYYAITAIPLTAQTNIVSGSTDNPFAIEAQLEQPTNNSIGMVIIVGIIGIIATFGSSIYIFNYGKKKESKGGAPQASLTSYIKKTRKKGFSDEVIKMHLLKSGWPKEIIEKELKKLKITT